MMTSSTNKLISFNCKSLKRSMESVRHLCDTADILALQETWLLPHDLPLLSTVHKDFEYTGKSAVDTSAGLLIGRPYGGVALLWRKGLFKSVCVVPSSSARISAIKACLEDRAILVFSIYMPTDSTDNFIEFTECLSEVSAIIEASEVEAIYILGDFNSHPHQPFWTELCKFSLDQQWVCADVEKLGLASDSYTYVSDMNGSRRWLDHCFVTQTAWQSVLSVNIQYDVFWSDHLPLVIECNLSKVPEKVEITQISQDKVKWHERGGDQIKKYHEICNSEFRNMHFPKLFSNCADKVCDNAEHRRGLQIMYQDIVGILSKAAIQTHEGDRPRGKKRIIGWNKHVRTAHIEARVKYQAWVSYNKPNSGKVWKEMRESQRLFKGKLKWCQNHQQQIKMDIISAQRSSKNFARFWKSTSRLDLKPALPVTVAGCSAPEDIANTFLNHFRVSSRLGPSGSGVKAEICHNSPLIRFSAKQVSSAIQKMSRGKSPGHDSLSIEHLKHAGVHCPRVLSTFYSLCLSHSYLPPELTDTIVVPIVKSRTGDVSDVNNYRPISLATVLAKVLDSLLDKTLNKYLKLNDAQFGFRAGLSTESAILSLKQTVRYYTDRRTPVYACFLDLSKAFDLVSYDILWQKLGKACVPAEIIRVFQYWYDNQVNYVKWNNSLSAAYGLECGVRQGGLTSPKLFNLYVNELIDGLSSKRIGCWIDNICVNNLSYADDMVLLGPTAGSIRELLKLCEQYAASHGLLYNCRKSLLMIFKATGRTQSYEPIITLNGQPLQRVKQAKYLGHCVTEDLKDHEDIERERRALAVRGNMLVRRFACCSKEVKITLFKAYCQTFYTSGLWTSYTRKIIDALRVQYNNSFRMLLGLPRFCSASDMFAQARVHDFHAMVRKKTASLLERSRSSPNGILKMLMDKFDSPMMNHFMQVLVRQE